MLILKVIFKNWNLYNSQISPFMQEGKESIAAKFEGISGMFSLILVLFWSCSLGESLEEEVMKLNSQ